MRILFILKEAYGGNEDWSLTAFLRGDAYKENIWRRVIEWTYGICGTTENKIERFYQGTELYAKDNKWLQRIAVLNIKKSAGQSSSVYGEISAYADCDKDEILKEIELIDPGIIICGSTFSDIDRIMGTNCKRERYSENWYYYTDAIGDTERLFIDYYHPGNHYPSLINYYGVVNIYQQALLEKELL